MLHAYLVQKLHLLPRYTWKINRAQNYCTLLYLSTFTIISKIKCLKFASSRICFQRGNEQVADKKNLNGKLNIFPYSYSIHYRTILMGFIYPLSLYRVMNYIKYLYKDKLFILLYWVCISFQQHDERNYNFQIKS